MINVDELSLGSKVYFNQQKYPMCFLETGYYTLKDITYIPEDERKWFLRLEETGLDEYCMSIFDISPPVNKVSKNGEIEVSVKLKLDTSELDDFIAKYKGA